MKSKKFMAVALAAITMGTMTAFASCGSDGDSTGSTGGSGTSGTAEKVTLSFAGSTSVQPLMGALADAYMEKNKNVEIEVQGGGSAVGISNAQEGKGDFGMASKHVDEEGVTSVKIADDGIVVIVNKASELTNVTGAQLYDLYTTGTAIGSATLPVAREEGSGTRDAFEDLVKSSSGEKLKDTETRYGKTESFNSTGVAMTKVATTKAALGYISLGSLNDTVKALTFEGVAATVENVKNKSYTMSRPFELCYNTEKGLSEEAQAFLDFILSEEGQEIVADEGYITIL